MASLSDKFHDKALSSGLSAIVAVKLGTLMLFYLSDVHDDDVLLYVLYVSLSGGNDTSNNNMVKSKAAHTGVSK